MVHRCLIALGSNLENGANSPRGLINYAIERLGCDVSSYLRVSRVFQSPAFPIGSGPDFLNAAVTLQSPLSPRDILDWLHEIEADAARVREQRWGPRTLDLDLIAVDDLVLPDADTQAYWRDLPLADQMRDAPQELILPHPRMQDRAFVLVPLADVAPDWRHPVLGKSVIQMRDALDPADIGGLVPLEA